MDVDLLWDTYYSADDSSRSEAKDALILHYMPLVHYSARKIASKLPNSVDVNDLINDGFFGLVESIDKFEPEKGFKFQTYAVKRIHGEILDKLRVADWVPRSLRSKFRKVERAHEFLSSTLFREPTDQEMADHLEWPLEEVQEVNYLYYGSSFAALDDVLHNNDGDEKIHVSDTIADNTLMSPTKRLEIEELKQYLLTAIGSLQPREQVVMILYYVMGKTLQDVGSILDVTESRVCQIHTKALSNLRELCVLS